MNYRNFYRMHSDPFPLIPEKEVFFESTTHLKAVEFILQCIKEKDIFILIAGDYGTGKTLLCLRLLEMLKDSENVNKVIYLPTPNVSNKMILKMISRNLALPLEQDVEEDKIQEMIFEHFEKSTDKGSRFLIVMDDFQEYSASAIDHIKWLGSFHTQDGFFPFLLIFFAHPSVIEKINSPLFGSLSQKIRKRYFLNAFDEIETKEYIYFRLLNSGAKGFPYFPDDVILDIYKQSRGIPRLINTICDACLVIGAREEKKVIDKSILKKALSELRFSSTEEAIIHDVKDEKDRVKSEEKFSEPSPISPSQDSSQALDFSGALEFTKEEGPPNAEAFHRKAFIIWKYVIYGLISFVLIALAIIVGDRIKGKLDLFLKDKDVSYSTEDVRKRSDVYPNGSLPKSSKEKLDSLQKTYEDTLIQKGKKELEKEMKEVSPKTSDGSTETDILKKEFNLEGRFDSLPKDHE